MNHSAEGPVKQKDWVSRVPFYYGWVILGVGTLGIVMTSPGQTFVVSMFIEHLIRDLELSRSAVSTLYMIGTLGNAVLLQLLGVGRIIDRRGPRIAAVVSATLLAGACFYMGFVSSALMLVFGFMALRFFGQGSLNLVSSTMINMWWVRRRGTLRGASGIVSSLMTGVFPGIAMVLIGAIGWRSAYAVLGGVLLVVMVPIAAFLYRRRPEDHGMEPDGGAPKREPKRKVFDASIDYTLKQALRTPLFWVLSCGIASMSMLGTGLIFHMESIVTDQGLAAAVAAAVFVPIGMTQAILRLPAGFLVDHVSPKLVLTGALILQAVVLLLAPRLTSTTSAMVYGGVFGAMQVGWGAAGAVMWAKYYGRAHLGSISGAGMSIAIVGSALGPMAMGVARDLMGTYSTFCNLAALIPLALAVAAVLVRPPLSDKAPSEEAISA